MERRVQKVDRVDRVERVERWLFLVQRSAPFSPAMTDLQIRLQLETCKEMFGTCEHVILHTAACSSSRFQQEFEALSRCQHSTCARSMGCFWEPLRSYVCWCLSSENHSLYVCQPVRRWRRFCLRFWPLSLFHQRRRELQSCRAMAPSQAFCSRAIRHCFVLAKMATAN